MARSATAVASTSRSIRPAEKPVKARGRGRTRAPSEFDGVIQDYFGQGWQEVQCTDEEDAKHVYKELKRSADLYSLGITRDLNTDEFVVGFEVHEKRSRGPRGPRPRDENGNVITKAEAAARGLDGYGNDEVEEME